MSGNNQPTTHPVLQKALLLSAGLSLGAAAYLVNQAWGTGPYLGMARGWLIRLLPVAVWGLAALWAGLRMRFPGRALLAGLVGNGAEDAGAGPAGPRGEAGWAALGAWLILPVLFLGLARRPEIELIERSLPRWWIFAHLALLGGVLLRAGFGRGRFLAWAAASLLVIAAGLKALAFLPEMSTYPFTLGWSETSRYVNAALFFARSLYGEPAPLPVLHPTRYLMQSVPFLIPSLPLWFHRLWQVLLWIGVSGMGGWALARRLKLTSGWLAALTAIWAALFFFQGAVYYHLMVVAILVLLGFDRRRFWRSLLIVSLAGLWAGVSRVNWIPLPAALAGLLYLLEEPLEGRPGGLIGYLGRPAVWGVVSIAAGLFSQFAYTQISGNPPDVFGSSFSSDLLWYRLWPNATFAPGIVRAASWAALPVVLLLLVRMMRGGSAWATLRWAGIWLVLGVFFAGGLVVSVKIGGGADLHNLDACLVLLAVSGAYVLFERFTPDRPERTRPLALRTALAAFALLVPIIPVLAVPGPVQGRDLAQANAAVARLQSHLDNAAGGEVLFISERHLLTFDLVVGPGHIPEYEKVFLMEMAMGNNRAYLDRFEADLRAHRFALIISDPVSAQIKDASYSFGEENNAWVERVVQPMLSEYSPIDTLENGAVVVLAPR